MENTMKLAFEGNNNQTILFIVLAIVVTAAVVLLIVSMINRSKKEREEMIKAQSSEEANYLLNLSYELRTNMNTITGYTNLLKQHLGDDEKASKYLKTIEVSSNRILDVINTLPLIATQGSTEGSLSKMEDGSDSDERPHLTTRDLIGKNALVVDDVELNREIAKDVLEEYGMHVDAASNGSEALELCKSRMGAENGQSYDLILMDIQMPGMDGYETTKQIRSLPDENINKIPIVALTVNFMDIDKKKAYGCGMNAYIIKPLHVDELLEAIEKSLA